MAPLKVGDFITYSGIEVGVEIICYSIIANIGILTSPGVAPGFIAVEQALIGILDPTNVGLEDARSKVCFPESPQIPLPLLILGTSSSAFVLTLLQRYHSGQ